jgi:hypothetical protein
MPKHYKVKKAMAGTKTKLADKDQMLMAKKGVKAPMYMMGGKVFEGAQGLMTALAKKNPTEFKKIAEGIK